MLRKTYVNDDRTSNLEKVKSVTFEGTSSGLPMFGYFFLYIENPRYKGKNYKPWKDGSLKRQPEIGVNENAGGEGNPQAKVRCTLCNNDISADNRCDQIKATNPRNTLNIVSIDLKLYSRTEIGHSRAAYLLTAVLSMSM